VSSALQIGGAPLLRLEATDAPQHGPAFLAAEVLPGRGMMLLQAELRLPSGEVAPALHAPPAVDAVDELDGGPADFAGNRSFSFGGAILAPYANRITGDDVPGAREIETRIDGQTVRLPRNWGGKAPGAAQYAMHGLILATRAAFEQPAPDRVRGRLAAGDFGGRWPSQTEMDFEWRLAGGALELAIEVRNVGRETLPFGLGWHPYFALPSQRRRQARLHLAAARRAEVNNYDEVLPTGRLSPVAGTDYDFAAAGGRALGELYLDDCFTDLARSGDGRFGVEVLDPAAGLGLRISTPTPQVKAVQVFAPPDKPFVVVEPQFNLADPESEVWPKGVDTGLAHLAPGERLTYEVAVTPFRFRNPVDS
jgi:predicted outer membrane repeat protein